MNQKDLQWSEFERVEMRVGTIVQAEVFPEARQPAYKIHADFGDLGILKTSAQVTQLYTPEALVGRQIVGVVNFPEKQIANIRSQFLLLGAIGEEKEITLLSLERPVKNGARIG